MTKKSSTKNQNILSNIESYLDQKQKVYDELYENAKLENITLERANKEQVGLSGYVDQQKVELKYVLNLATHEKNIVKGTLYNLYTEKYSRDLTEKGKTTYIEGHKNYITVDLLCLEIEEMYDKYEALSHMYTTRGYSLRNITNTRVAEISDTII